MGVWRIGADTLAHSRFTVSALAETLAELLTLHGNRTTHPGREEWRRTHGPGYRRRLAADPVAALVAEASVRSRWPPDFMSPPPGPEDRTFHDELRRVRDTPAAAALADLAITLDGPVPAGLRVPDLPDRVADLLDWVWTHCVAPDWSRRRRVFEADALDRTRRLGTGGWAAALDGMRPGLRWRGDGELQLVTAGHPPRDLTGARLHFVPASVRRSWVAWAEPHRYAIVYPCPGLLVEPAEPRTDPALSRLLGPARATILTLLGTPRSSIQLVALTGYGPGSVGGHLRVLLDARLARRRRAGRVVLYQRTPTGDQLVDVQDGGGPAG